MAGGVVRVPASASPVFVPKSTPVYAPGAARIFVPEAERIASRLERFNAASVPTRREQAKVVRKATTKTQRISRARILGPAWRGWVGHGQPGYEPPLGYAADRAFLFSDGSVVNSVPETMSRTVTQAAYPVDVFRGSPLPPMAGRPTGGISSVPLREGVGEVVRQPLPGEVKLPLRVPQIDSSGLFSTTHDAKVAAAAERTSEIGAKTRGAVVAAATSRPVKATGKAVHAVLASPVTGTGKLDSKIQESVPGYIASRLWHSQSRFGVRDKLWGFLGKHPASATTAALATTGAATTLAVMLRNKAALAEGDRAAAKTDAEMGDTYITLTNKADILRRDAAEIAAGTPSPGNRLRNAQSFAAHMGDYAGAVVNRLGKQLKAAGDNADARGKYISEAYELYSSMYDEVRKSYPPEFFDMMTRRIEAAGDSVSPEKFAEKLGLKEVPHVQ